MIDRIMIALISLALVAILAMDVALGEIHNYKSMLDIIISNVLVSVAVSFLVWGVLGMTLVFLIVRIVFFFTV